MRTTTTHYDIAEHLRTSEEMAAYLEACIVEADGDAAFIAKALGDIARAQGCPPTMKLAGALHQQLVTRNACHLVTLRFPRSGQWQGHGECLGRGSCEPSQRHWQRLPSAAIAAGASLISEPFARSFCLAHAARPQGAVSGPPPLGGPGLGPRPGAGRINPTAPPRSRRWDRQHPDLWHGPAPHRSLPSPA